MSHTTEIKNLIKNINSTIEINSLLEELKKRKKDIKDEANKLTVYTCPFLDRSKWNNRNLCRDLFQVTSTQAVEKLDLWGEKNL